MQNNDVRAKMLALLDEAKAEYKVYEHRAVWDYEGYEAVAKETGWQGTEGKNLVMKSGDDYLVYATLQGARVDTKAMKKHLGTKKLRMANAEELDGKFGAEPGNAYPFGFDADVQIIVDPAVFEQEWLLLSLGGAEATVQVRGADLTRVFEGLPNEVEILAMNQE
ncbi:MAG TPA: YbaK/EbsC family protein [Thermomicrobiales bacterium]|nr:YbaK/EbsC family protein [Thermomicrobiales bacterium]